VITVTVLNTVHHSPLLAVCAALTGAAAYLQATYVSPGCAALVLYHVWWCLTRRGGCYTVCHVLSL
jgi:predicted nicotinamide N-methyase